MDIYTAAEMAYKKGYEKGKEESIDLYTLMKECYAEKQAEKKGRAAARIPYILVEIEEMWRAHPDLRLGQLIMNVVDNRDVLYYLEDEELLKRLRDFYS